MNLSRIVPIFLLCSGYGYGTSAVTAAEVKLEYLDQVTNFFGDQDAKWQFTITSSEKQTATVQWRLLAAGRTLVSREEELTLTADQPQIFAAEYHLPAVNDGIISPLELQVSLSQNIADAPKVQLNTQLFLFPANPFDQQTQWLKALDLHVFDPVETTHKLFNDWEIPYTPITQQSALEDLQAGIVIVGAGVNFDDYDTLAAALFAAAARGVTVLCLAPASAQFPCPKPGSEAPLVSQFSLPQKSFVRELDKRLSLIWSNDASEIANGLTLTTDQDQVVLATADSGQGWPWMVVEYSRPAGFPVNQPAPRFIYCGLNLVGMWDQSPTPRYIFASLLRTFPTLEKNHPTTP